ncbi:threonine/serine exporter family protein [Amygdalobacter nucleatus]|nr:threonine/serine exporter family protein [Amygdalobacter nucleatus]MDF0485457.1 threonine/serine exporter family protein [Amygdalobacter nucleatus]WEG36684.1 threonine/serine exporter family protein [Amygdalobacter nucleatus]
MNFYLQLLIAFIASFIACLGFNILFENKGKYVFLSSLGGGIAWVIYVYFRGDSIALASFLSGAWCAAYAEVMAKIYKSPATIFLIIAILPMVPGADIFNMMKAAVFNDIELLMRSMNNTLTISGYIALGIIIVFSLVVLVKNVLRNLRKKKSMLS